MSRMQSNYNNHHNRNKPVSVLELEVLMLQCTSDADDIEPVEYNNVTMLPVGINKETCFMDCICQKQISQTLIDERKTKITPSWFIRIKLSNKRKYFVLLNPLH